MNGANMNWAVHQLDVPFTNVCNLPYERIRVPRTQQHCDRSLETCRCAVL